MLKKHKRIILLGWRNHAIERAKELGIEVIFIQKKERYKETQGKQADQVHLLDYEDMDSLLPLVHYILNDTPVDAVISFTEEGLIPAAKAQESLGLHGNSVETVTLLRDKWLMRQRLQERGFSPVSAQLGSTMEDLIKFTYTVSSPVIVKPTDGEGSRHIFLIENKQQMHEVWQEISRLGIHKFLMEEYLDGPEVSVESFSFQGHHVVFAITDKLTLPNFVEIGHSMPSQLEVKAQEQIRETVQAFLDVIGFQDGPSHTELRLTSTGPRIIESHNRIGGDKINELFKIAFGLDMLTMTFAWATGQMEAITLPHDPLAAAAIRFFAPSPGKVINITGMEEVKSSPDVMLVEVKVEIGDQVHPIRHSFDRPGCIIVKGCSTQEAVEKCSRYAHMVNIICQ